MANWKQEIEEKGFTEVDNKYIIIDASKAQKFFVENDPQNLRLLKEIRKTSKYPERPFISACNHCHECIELIKFLLPKCSESLVKNGFEYITEDTELMELFLNNMNVTEEFFMDRLCEVQCEQDLGELDLILKRLPHLDLNEALVKRLGKRHACGSYFIAAEYLISKGANDFRRAYNEAVKVDDIRLMHYFLAKRVEELEAKS